MLCHKFLKIFLRYLFINVHWSLVMLFLFFHRRTGFSLLLKILKFVATDITLAFHIDDE